MKLILELPYEIEKALRAQWSDEFLKKAEAHLHYSAQDLAQDLRTLRELGSQ
ncbi:MAG TPA: hypothetical protein VHR45_19325 [Thermoanaerobaculia bacterium]|nr:hypothetical protein [Thermoanaerobaculia bacterium]